MQNYLSVTGNFLESFLQIFLFLSIIIKISTSVLNESYL